MLVLTRKAGEEVVIGDNVIVKVVSIRGGTIRLGVEAPREVPVHRQEIFLRNGHTCEAAATYTSPCPVLEENSL